MVDVQSFWAKFAPATGQYLSLFQHGIDTANLMPHVASVFVSTSTMRQLEQAVAPASLPKLLTTLGFAHDLGKISHFQAKVPELAARLDSSYRLGHVSQADHRDAPHAAVSALSFTDWLKARATVKLGRQARRGWEQILGGHHGVFPNPDQLLATRRVLGVQAPQWAQARFAYLDEMAAHFDITQTDIDSFAQLTWSPDKQAVLTGLLIATDWIASDEQLFPYDNLPEQDRLERALSRIDIGHPWQPERSAGLTTFADQFDLPATAEMNAMQTAVVQMASDCEAPSLIIVESETGSGKTEAALLAARELAANHGANGIFFAQPTRVNADAMFQRVRDWLERSNASSSSVVSMLLAHGKSAFNEQYVSLFRNRYFQAQPRSIFDEPGTGLQSGGITIEAPKWVRGRKTALLGSVVVGTIDQLLFAALSSKHLVLRHLGLAGKVVIIDEVHAADTWMNTYLTRMLWWLGAYGVNVIALSATLPVAQRDALCGAYLAGAKGLLQQPTVATPVHGYPRVTSVSRDCDVPKTTVIPLAGASKTVSVKFFVGDQDDIAEHVIELSRIGGCIGVICDTVGRAQQLYSRITTDSRVLADGTPVLLLHSRFLADQRASIETTIVQKLGRDATQRPKRLLVIATQILEQGLDLDFDVLVSDLAPTDLLLQRIGRLHRHPSNHAVRPEAFRTPTIFITGLLTPTSVAQPGDIARGIVQVYRRLPLLHTLATLHEQLSASGEVVQIPEDVEQLMYRTYTAPIIPEGWSSAVERASAAEQRFETRQAMESARFCIDPPTQPLSTSFNRLNIPADEAAAGAQVRDADAAVEVIVVRRQAGRIYALDHVTELADIPLDEVAGLTEEHARRLASCTVRLPGWIVSDELLYQLESDGLESWQQSAWLAGQLPLILDEDFSSVHGAIMFRYDYALGLLVERINHDE
ncbi:CRISPR-associated helicase Cas3' [Corynebacterium choanae]|uniref:CRISPR-associated nuclease/helicase Cas3 n=1 Tax=Corynebacterium choanae TaxID=1862358 RepID=A0A3G6J3Q7_9CORY|nr:CRISPR-associated helicase Cas3' [Corynebacterium choanae]AZA12559.1 CRISPR-associated nuclease/helicase Cas3 [Corynebacterium choanae]